VHRKGLEARSCIARSIKQHPLVLELTSKGIVMKRCRLISLLLVGATAAALSLAVEPPASANGAVVPLRNYGNGKCLQPVNSSPDQGAAIVQQPCNGSIAQGWAFIPLGGTTYHFMNQLSGFCLDARGGAVNGTPVDQWTCNSITNENWDTGLTLPDAVPLTSRVSGTHSHCLDVSGGQALNGLAMQIYRCNGTYAQGWVVGQA
jgi:hypothetical protein